MTCSTKPQAVELIRANRARVYQALGPCNLTFGSLNRTDKEIQYYEPNVWSHKQNFRVDNLSTTIDFEHWALEGSKSLIINFIFLAYQLTMWVCVHAVQKKS